MHLEKCFSRPLMPFSLLTAANQQRNIIRPLNVKCWFEFHSIRLTFGTGWSPRRQSARQFAPCRSFHLIGYFWLNSHLQLNVYYLLISNLGECYTEMKVSDPIEEKRRRKKKKRKSNKVSENGTIAPVLLGHSGENVQRHLWLPTETFCRVILNVMVRTVNVWTIKQNWRWIDYKSFQLKFEILISDSLKNSNNHVHVQYCACFI